MATVLYRGLSLVVAALSAYLLVQVGGPIVAVIPLAIGALLSVFMQAAINSATPAVWQAARQKKSTARERLAGYGYVSAAIAIPSLAVGLAGITHGPLIAVACILGAAWLTVWGFGIAARLGRRLAYPDS